MGAIGVKDVGEQWRTAEESPGSGTEFGSGAGTAVELVAGSAVSPAVGSVGGLELDASFIAIVVYAANNGL